MYYENLGIKLNNSLLLVKTYWPILKAFYNDKEISLISCLLTDNKFVKDITTKANIFNNFFAEQCTSLKNGSVLPSSQEFLTQEMLCSFDFSNEEIFKLIRSLNLHKAHGNDDFIYQNDKNMLIISKFY